MILSVCQYLVTTLSKQNKTLIELDLFTSQIGDESVKSLVKVLVKNKELQSLNLNGNGIGIEGMKAIAIALKGNETLVNLDLGNNKIDDAVLQVLIEALTENTTLSDLKLVGGNRISQESKDALRALDSKLPGRKFVI